MINHQDVSLTQFSQSYFVSWKLKNLYKCMHLYSELDEPAKYQEVNAQLKNAIFRQKNKMRF